MLHEPSAQPAAVDHAVAGKTRMGLWLFALYCLLYGGFVAINTWKPKLMESDGLFGTNLAVTYGFGLIIFAIVLGLIYNALCTRLENRLNAPAGKGD